MHITNSVELGKLLRDRRRVLGLTQQDVARRAMVSRRTLIDVEAGTADIGLRRLFCILGSLGLGLNLLPTKRPTWDQLRDIFRDDDE